MSRYPEIDLIEEVVRGCVKASSSWRNLQRSG